MQAIWRVFALSLTIAAGASCTRASDRERFPPTADRLRILQTIPTAGESNIPTDVQIDVCLSDLVDPRAVDDVDLNLLSGELLFDTQLAVQLWPWRGPGGLALAPGPTGPWCEGSVLSISPRVELTGGILYRLRMQASAVGWAGERLDTEQPGWIEDANGIRWFFLEFTTASAPSDSATDTGTDTDTGTGTDTDTDTGTSTDGETSGNDIAPTLTELFAVGGPFDRERGLCGCHTPDGPANEALALDLLDLSSPERAFDELVLPVTLEETGFPMVLPRRPSESFLIQKLLREDDGSAIRGIHGSPMPPDRPLPYADFVRIAEWIDGGALP